MRSARYDGLDGGRGLRQCEETNSGKSRDLVTDVLKHSRKLVQSQAFVVVLVVEFKEFFDL